jgi:hypothetical protein
MHCARDTKPVNWCGYESEQGIEKENLEGTRDRNEAAQFKPCNGYKLYMRSICNRQKDRVPGVHTEIRAFPAAMNMSP